jgi:hypothetical protein
MKGIADNAEFFVVLRRLIDAWCDRRALRPLSLVLGPYLAFDGLTDTWGKLLIALKTVSASYQKDISETELDSVRDLIRAAEPVVYRNQTRN